MAYIGTSPSNGVRRRFVYEATASQTSFSGNDENGVTLTYVDSLYLDVFQNGIKLKAGDDYTATTGTSVVLVQGASANDVVEMVAFDVFSVNDSVSAKDGGSFAGNIGMGGTLAVTGVTTGTIIKGTTSLQTPLIEFTDGDDAIAIADAGIITIKNTSSVIQGEGSNTTIISQGLAKVWFSFDMADDSDYALDTFNSSAGTDHGTGNLTITFTNDMANINYSASQMTSMQSDTRELNVLNFAISQGATGGTAPAAGSLMVQNNAGANASQSGTPQDPKRSSVTVHGDLA